MMGHDLTQDGAQGAGTERVVIGDGQMMFAPGLRGQAAVRAKLPDKLVAESAAQGLFLIRGR
jgi:hypothetical protein